MKKLPMGKEKKLTGGTPEGNSAATRSAPRGTA